MPTVTFSAGASSSPRALITAIENTTGSATVVFASATLIRLNLTGPGGILYQYEISGSGITVGLSGGNPVLTGGLIDGLTVTQAGALQMTVTGLGLTALALQAAISQDNGGANIAAIENLFLPLGWDYHGNANADILLATDTSGDGVLLNLSGNDTFATGGGADNVFLGDGNDSAHGGTGNDQFYGGTGRDKLYGDGNNDRIYGGIDVDFLYGGTGRDALYGDDGNDKIYGGANAPDGLFERLFGGRGNDLISGGSGLDDITGGAGNDSISGGTEDDILTGNAGADTFLFAVGDGDDQISDFDLVNDVIDLAPGAFTFTNFAGLALLNYGAADSVLLSAVAFTDIALVTVI